MFMLVTQFLRLVTMFGVGTFALNWDWRKTISICTVLMALQDFMVNFVATWGYMRWQNAYLGLSSLSAIPQTIIFLFNSYIIVEVADVGNESMVFALMSSFSNLGWPLGTVLAKTFDSFLDANLDSIEDDSTKTRWQITYSACFVRDETCNVGIISHAATPKVICPQFETHGQLEPKRSCNPRLLLCSRCLVLAGGRGC
ncbi:hypothetical protein AeMF1_019935 [Aphanomyces euteiches]|nr:hypothetical protein AeMF1_019935 [Aphanomyces euteiches]KAH9183297.1 hypothetical protein AeNC1_014727 [Aphanomyces euteiches]